MKSFMTKKKLCRILKKYQNIFFDNEEEYLIADEEISKGTSDKYRLVFGFGENKVDGNSSIIEYCQKLNPNNIFGSLEKWINYYKANDVFGLYLTEKCRLAIDIVDQDDDCLYILGWHSVREYQKKKTKYLSKQNVAMKDDKLKNHNLKPFNKRCDLWQCINCGELHLNVSAFKKTKCL